jgi:hypothetical protein
MINKLTCPFPSNINPLSSGGFKLSIQKLPEVTFWCNEANLPGMTIGAATFSTPFAQIQTPGDTISYDSLDVQFMIDSEMVNYKALWFWMYGIGFPESWENFQDLIDTDSRGIQGNAGKLVSDGSLTVLNNSFVPIKTIQFIDMWPAAINSLQLQSNNSDIVYLMGSATFNFSHWKFVD